MIAKATILGGALALSLAGNVFFAGLYVGHRTPPPFLAHHDAPRPPGPRGVAHALEESLSPGDAKLFHDTMEKDLPTTDKDVEPSFAAMETLLKAPDFDPEGFQAAMQRIHDQHTAMDTAFVKAVSEAAAKISPEGRVKLAEVIARSPRGPVPGGPVPGGPVPGGPVPGGPPPPGEGPRFDHPHGPPPPPQ